MESLCTLLSAVFKSFDELPFHLAPVPLVGCLRLLRRSGPYMGCPYVWSVSIVKGSWQESEVWVFM